MPEPKEPTEVLAPVPAKKGTGTGKRLFQKGQSGNPGGRPKGYQEFREAARELTPRAMKTLEDLLEHDDGRVRFAAAKELLDRGWGRPATTLEVGITPESALAKLAAALADDDNTEES